MNAKTIRTMRRNILANANLGSHQKAKRILHSSFEVLEGRQLLSGTAFVANSQTDVIAADGEASSGETMRVANETSAGTGDASVGITAIGQTINWDIQTSSDPLYSGNNGVLSGSGSYWNSSYSNSTNALDESGASTSVDLVLRQWMGSVTRSGSHALFGEGLTAGWSSPLIYDITDLDPYTTYDVALYFQASNKADVYFVDAGRTTHTLTTLYNSRVLPGAEGGEYLRFRTLKPYESSPGVYSLKFYVYSQSSIINEALAGVQIKSIGSRVNIEPHAPTLITPVNNATGVDLTPTLQASAFSDPDPGDTQANSQWLIDNNSDFSSPEWNSTDAYAPATSVTLPSGILAYATKYYWRVRYKDSAGNWSPYSSSSSFTTGSDSPVYNGSANNDSVCLSFINNQFAITDLSGNILNVYNGSSLKIDLAAGADTLVLDASILTKTLALTLANTENVKISCNASSSLALTLSNLNLNSISAYYTGTPTFTLQNPALNSLTLTGAVSLQLATPNLVVSTGSAQTLRQYLANAATGAKPSISCNSASTLALLDNSKLHKTSFAGITLSSPFSQLLIRPATPADANLDGKVDQNDLLPIFANLNKSNATWLNGDVDQSGTVNLTDLAIVQSKLSSPSVLSLKTVLKSPAKAKIAPKTLSHKLKPHKRA